MFETIIVYTDGACSGNPGPGGWGAIIERDGKQTELSGYEDNTTNNRMELMAAIKALESLEEGKNITLYTDSTYVRDGISSWIEKWKANGWQTASKKSVKNQDLWMRLDALGTTRTIDWQWIRGHSGHPMNERADVLARGAIVTLRMAQEMGDAMA